MTIQSTTTRRALVAASLLTLSLSIAVGCDPADTDLELDAEAEALELESESEAAPDEVAPVDGATLVDDVIPPPPVPETAVGADRTPNLDLANADDPTTLASWGSWVSEETPPDTCDTGQIVTAVDCYGPYCDEVQLYCASHGYGSGSRSWSPWFSEEGTSWQYCASGSFVSGVACHGWWCDEVSIECTDIGKPHAYCSWSGWHASNDPWYVAPTGYAVAGVQCGGAYCDQMRFYQCAI